MSSMKAFTRILSILICTTFCVSCSGGGSGAFPTFEASAVINALPGGIWVGVDTGTGGRVEVVVAEDERFRFLDQVGNQGSGILSVSNGNNVSGNFQLVRERGLVFPDGTTLADCTLSGTVKERQTMEVTVNCTTTAGPLNQITADLDYDTIYDRDSSLATIAGMYDDGSGIVTDIASDGAIFEQDPFFGCVTNGLVSVINSEFNAYDYQFGISNCTGPSAVFNGSNFFGFASLDNTTARETLIVAATGEVDGILVSVIIVARRL